MPQIAGRVKIGLPIILCGIVLAACGQKGDREAETVAEPVRHVVTDLTKNPKWAKGKCLCVGLFRGEAVEDFPAGLLAREFQAHPFLRNWSECAAHYGKKQGLSQCKAGMIDYICSTVERPGLAAGTTRVMCHVNGKNELLFDEYDVTRQQDRLTVTSIGVKALQRVREQEENEK